MYRHIVARLLEQVRTGEKSREYKVEFLNCKLKHSALRLKSSEYAVAWRFATANDVARELADDDACAVCLSAKRAESILCCDTCDKGFHLDCLTPPLAAVPDGDWSCPRCPARPW